MNKIVLLYLLFNIDVIISVNPEIKTLYQELPLKPGRQIIKSLDHYGYYFCPKESNKYCDRNSTYRSYDGSCNNLHNDWWGKSNTPFKRLLKPNYEDEKNHVRQTGKNGKALPNPRMVTLKAFKQIDTFIDVSHLALAFANFVGNDLIHSKPKIGDDGFQLGCACDSRIDGCLAVPIPSQDLVNSNKKCLIQVRHSSSDIFFKCSLGYREQLNQQTSFLDLSQLYGNNAEANQVIRDFEGGRIASSYSSVDYEEKFPSSNCPFMLKNNPEYPEHVCFVGDIRANDYAQVGAFHILWMREHNRVVGELSSLNPHWDDEKLFQEGRKIVIAEYASIIYGDILPLIVGKRLATMFDLFPKEKGYFVNYDDTVFPNVDNELSLAFRFGHVMTPLAFSLVDDNDYISGKLSIYSASFDSGFFFAKDAFKNFIRGLLNDRASAFKLSMNKEMRDNLLYTIGPHNPSSGHSLSTWNINRCRERGIQPYNLYREMAGLNKATDFNDLTHISKENIEKLKSVYNDVDDIDFWVGCVSETPLEEALVGPTMAYIIARAFRNSKISDRFYFENGIFKQTRFSLEQLGELRKASLARIICDNAGLDKIQENPLIVYDKNENQYISCESIPRVTLDLWSRDYS